MPITKQILPVILCGGTGSRLWPLSRKTFPKQYLSIKGENSFSFLQETLERIKLLNDYEEPLIICNEEHRFITAEQLRKINIKPKSIILEPSIRNTAPAIAIAALDSYTKEYDPILLILPSDHQIKNKKIFIRTIQNAKNITSEGKIVAFGINPDNPATGYGYIKSYEPFIKNKINPYKIEKFIEKPNKEQAAELIKDKRFSWNSGIYMAKASTIIAEINKFHPEIISFCKDSLDKKVIDLDFKRIEKKSFEKCPNISIDKAIMEKTALGMVLPLNADWSDIGNWKSYWENTDKDENGNILIGDSSQISSKNSLIGSFSRLTIALGIEDLIIVETNDAILVAKKDFAENVRDLVEQLKIKNRKEGEENKKIYRPWGNYLTIEESSNWKVKVIEVKPGESLSLQLHEKRAEHWVVVEGTAKVEIGEEIFLLNSNESCYVPLGHKHRLKNPSTEKLIIIEVQSGTYLGEDDIVRFKDNYGR